MLSLILAIDKNRGMGFQGRLPWQLKKDMAYFKALTTSSDLEETEKKFGLVRDGTIEAEKSISAQLENNVIMGRKTWESIPEKFRPLKGRNNIILSRTVTDFGPGTNVHSSLDNAMNLSENSRAQSFIIGGNEIYIQGIVHPRCQRIYLTQIYHEFECDTFFPEIPENFELNGSSNELNEEGVPFRFLVYENKKA